MVAAGFTRTSVQSVTTLAQQLKEAREKRESSIIDAEAATSVAAKYLIALENGCYQELPVDVYAAGFVRRYAEWLELDSSAAVAKYRSERALADASAPRKKCRLTDESIVRARRPLAAGKLLVTPERFIGLVVSMAILMFVGYLWFQVKSFAAAPPLDIPSTVDNSIVKVDTLTLSGTTDAAAKLAVNGQLVPVDQTGKFTATIRLVDGVNTIEVRAQNKTDQETVKVLKVLATLDGNNGTNATGAELPVTSTTPASN